MPVYIDQMNRRIVLEKIPSRIVSLVPSQTEFLFDLGLDKSVVGITKFCVHPQEWFQSKTRVGGTKKIDFDKIKELAPDLIIGNKEENQKQQVEELMKNYPVWMSDISTLKDAYGMMVSIGEIAGKREEAGNIKLTIESAFNNLVMELATIPLERKRVAYLIWQKPTMVAGSGTFIDHLLSTCGLENVFADTGRYPEVTEQALQKADPEIIFLSSEPFPFKEKHVQHFQELCPSAKVMTVDGEMFSWYGSRLLAAPHYFSSLIKAI